jgi:carboxyl-terminal processing protease
LEVAANLRLVILFNIYVYIVKLKIYPTMHILNIKHRIRLLLSLFLVLLSSFIFSGCEKEEDPLPIDDEKELNRDFYAFMKEWYFWYESMPNIDPMSYPSPVEVLEAVRFRPLDRWSYITSWEAFEAYFRDSKMIGHGFGSGFDAAGNLRVLFIYNTTKMYEAGVRRSWVIEAINGTQVSPGMNISSLMGSNQVGVTNSFRFRAPDGSIANLSLAKEELVMSNVLHTEVIELGNARVGYLVLQGFTSPTVRELETAFDEFISAGIDELILDMRYNGGGQTSVANFLSSMIGGDQVSGQVFTKYMYNDKRTESNRTDTFQVVTRRLNLERLLTIGTRNTASASEMVINGLRPHMPVYIFGNTTYGKPMGANVFKDEDDTYAFVPITFKTANANGEGDFFDGLKADSSAPDDITRMFGDPGEGSLKAALHFIETGSFLDTPVAKSAHVQPRDRMTGLQWIIGAH